MQKLEVNLFRLLCLMSITVLEQQLLMQLMQDEHLLRQFGVEPTKHDTQNHPEQVCRSQRRGRGRAW